MLPGPLFSWPAIIRKFYAAANSINCHTKSVGLQELSRLYLFEAFTLPILTYGCDGIFVSFSNLRKMNVCWNNVYRKVFNMNIWESVKCIQLFYGRLDFVHIAVLRTLKFYNGYIEPITQLWKNVFVIFDVILGSESYVRTMMWWLIVTVYDMTFILSLNHCVDCSLSISAVSLYFYCIFTYVVNIRHIHIALYVRARAFMIGPVGLWCNSCLDALALWAK